MNFTDTVVVDGGQIFFNASSGGVFHKWNGVILNKGNGYIYHNGGTLAS